MPETCVECGDTPIYGYTEDREPLCSQCFDDYLGLEWKGEYSLEDELLDNEADCAD